MQCWFREMNELTERCGGKKRLIKDGTQDKNVQCSLYQWMQSYQELQSQHLFILKVKITSLKPSLIPVPPHHIIKHESIVWSWSTAFLFAAHVFAQLT